MRTTSIQLEGSAMELQHVSVLGMGCAPMLGRAGRAESIKALEVAFNLGINFFDTARSYGYGFCEGLLGEFIATKGRDRFVVCTKFGISPPDPGNWKQKVKPLARASLRFFPRLRGFAQKQAGGLFAPSQFSVSALKTSFETSLRELRTDYVDLLLMHAAPASVLEQDDLLESMERLVNEGKVRMAGISADHDVMRRAFTRRPRVLRTGQFALNLSMMELAQLTLEASRTMVLVANHPFGGPDGVAHCRSRIESMRRAIDLPHGLRQKLDLKDPQLMPELVLNSILVGTGISVVTAAMLQPQHIESNIRAVENCRFTGEELATVRSFFCTVRP